MIATNVTQLVRTQLAQHLDVADEAIEGIRLGMRELQLGNGRGYVDAMLEASRLGSSLQQAATAERMLHAAGDVATRQHPLGDALEAARGLVHRGDGIDVRSLEGLATSARTAMERDPGMVISIRAASTERLDTIATRLDDIDSAIASRTESASEGTHGWIGSDGEFHAF
jgi:hypothetical protein